MAKAKLGSGARFKKLEKSLEKQGAYKPSALAAHIGRSKYGAERMAMMASRGRKKK